MILQSIETVQLALKERNLDLLPVEKYRLYESMREFGKGHFVRRKKRDLE